MLKMERSPIGRLWCGSMLLCQMGMPWKFIPTQREVSVKPGESALAFYTAENLSSAPITGMSTYNVTPMKVII
ncbi:putative cytochrome c oxidase assembly protein CtaG/Cox11 [Helianthus annuus]|uniref:Putative cytochrome c oxidase assembly protein CtaG/Cox11 n=1 Tax=Helianthus annuus TaxID=4232 RepID=A0A251SPW0_HELAN|nr:putative cytochrome c oxidase assembly protein CtaG/Cox11 [Helianthus annuus]